MKTDLELQRDVQNELKWEPSITATEIGVTALNGVITLTGSVPSYLILLANSAQETKDL